MKGILLSIIFFVMVPPALGDVTSLDPTGTRRVVLGTGETARPPVPDLYTAYLDMGEPGVASVIWNAMGNRLCVGVDMKRGNELYFYDFRADGVKQIPFKWAVMDKLLPAADLKKYRTGRFLYFDPLRWTDDRHLVILIHGNLVDRKDEDRMKWYHGEATMSFEDDDSKMEGEIAWKPLTDKAESTIKR